MSRRLLPISAMVSVLLAASLSQPACCAGGDAQPAAGDAADALRFYRVYAPADRLKDWPWGNVKYMPVEPAEFERLLAIARAKTPGARASLAARLATALYQARLVGNQLVAGQASLQVIHSAEAPALLPLDPCGLAIGKASWDDDPPKGATFGLGVDGKLNVLVERSGRLDFAWSLGGRVDAGGAVGFQFQLPACPTSRLVLDLPEKMTPAVDHGVVVEADGADQGFRRWQIELGGHRRFRLRVVPAGAADQRPQLPLLRESVVYDFSLRGVDVSAKMNLGVHHEPLSQVVVALDPDLQLVTAQYGDAPVPWTISPANGSPGTRVVLTLPEPIQQPGGVLRLRALCPLVTDSLWALPRVRPEGTFWQQGSATLLVPAPLVIKQLAPVGCWQSATGPLPAPRVGESAQFKYFTPDATLKVVLSQRPAALQLLSGTTITLGGGETTARVVADFHVSGDPQFSLTAQVARQWLIDSVESLPPEAIDDWTLDKQGGGKRGLTVRLAKALSPARPVRLVIAARRLQSPLGRELGIDGLVPLRFEAGEDGKRLVTVRATGPYQLRLSGTEELNRIDPRSLAAAEMELFAELPRGLLFEEDAGTAQLRIALEEQKPSCSAILRTEARVGGGTLEERYTLRCVPESPRVERLVVQFSHPREVQPRWTLGAEEGQQLSVGPLSEDDPDAARLDPDKETWVLKLRRPRSEPFEITGTREIKLADGDRQPLSLPSVPTAVSQRATLVVRSLGPKGVQVTTDNRLQPIPAETVPPDRCQTACATYRYDPSRAPDAVVTVSTGGDDEVTPAWVWNCHLESWYEADGTGRHLATYRLQSSGSGAVRLTLPEGLGLQHVRGAWVDEHRVAWRLLGPEGGRGKAEGGKGKGDFGFGISDLGFQICDLGLRAAHCLLPTASCLPPTSYCLLPTAYRLLPTAYRVLPPANCLAVDLPRDEKFPTVSIHFVTPAARLGIVGSLEPPLPEADLPVLSRHWTVWLPPGYEAFDADLRWQPRRAPQLSWSRRLFGPLGRASGERAFDPLAVKHWPPAASGRPSRRLAERKAEQLLQILGDLAAGGAGGSESGGPDWAELLGHQSIDALQLTLLVDRRAMARLALTPRTPVRPGAGDDSSARGASLLQKANLAMLVCPDAVLLTGQTDAALVHAYLEPLGPQALWRVLPGPLAGQLQQAAAGEPQAGLVPVETWKREPADPKVVWTQPALAGYEPADAHGWTAYRLEIPEKTPDTPPLRLKLVHRQTMRLLGSVTFLLVIALGWWTAGNRPEVLALLVGVFGVAALVLPEAYVPPASGAVLGTLFCLVLGLIHRREAAGPPAPEGGRRPERPTAVAGATQLGIVVFVTAVMIAWCAAACGGEPGQESPPAAPPVHRVFIPIDQQQQPTGKYYVPEEFCKQLHRHAATATEEPQGWLLSAATYRGVLSREATSDRLVVDELKASFDLQVLGPMARVRIPLRREGANLLPDGALLDGRVIQPEWEADGGSLLVEVAERGEYRLELSLQPAMHSGEGPGGFELSIPRLATSRLELMLPPGAPAIEVPSAAGSILLEEEPPRMVAELGPCDRLTVQWPRGAGPGGTGPAVDVEELLWLKVQPGSVVVDAKFRFKIIEGQVRQLQLAADPRLRLLPLQGSDPPAAQVHVVPGGPQTITLQWPRPLSGATAVEATFLLTGTSGVGNLRLPELGTLDARPTRRWLAVSVDPALKHEEPASDRLEAVAVPDFLTNWGETEMQPLFAYRLGPGESDWSMRTYPREPLTTVEQKLVLSFDQRGAAVYFDAGLVTTAGYNFQYRLTVPSELVVERVSVLEEGVERVARWSKDTSENKKGTITIFLKEPVEGRQELSLRGYLPTQGKRGRVQLPSLQIDGGELKSSEVQLFRRPSVQIALSGTSGLAEQQGPLDEPSDPELGRLVGLFRAEGKDPIKAALTLRPNRPKARAVQVTRLYCEGGSWKAEVDCRIDVTEGLVDQLWMDAPSPWGGPYTVNPPLTLKVVGEPGEPRQLIVRPPAAIQRTYRFSISSPLELAPSDRPSAPAIELRGVGQVTRLLVLPKQAQGQPIDWETGDLSSAELPDGFSAPPPGSFATYEVDQPCRVVLKPLEHTRYAARVHLADVHVAWRADGTCRGVATFDLEPGKSTEVPLRLPSEDDYKLVQVSVAGVPTVPVSVPAKPNEWRVPLGPRQLPQRIEVVFTGILSEPAGRRFHAPTLGDLPVDQTLWTVVGPCLFEPDGAEGTRTVEPWRHELSRLKTAAALIESASAVAAEVPEETFRWYWPWARRLAAARTALRHHLDRTTATKETQAVRSEIGTINQRQSEIAARLGMTEVYQRLERYGVSVADDPVQLWQWPLERWQAATRYTFPERSSSLTLAYRRAEAGRLQGRLASAAGLAVLIVLVVLGLRRGTLAELFKRWPCAIGVALGLAWWLWLWPSILGWGIVLVSLLALLLSGWKHSRPAPGSSVVSFRSVQR